MPTTNRCRDILAAWRRQGVMTAWWYWYCFVDYLERIGSALPFSFTIACSLQKARQQNRGRWFAPWVTPCPSWLSLWYEALCRIPRFRGFLGILLNAPLFLPPPFHPSIHPSLSYHTLLSHSLLWRSSLLLPYQKRNHRLLNSHHWLELILIIHSIRYDTESSAEIILVWTFFRFSVATKPADQRSVAVGGTSS